MPCESAYNVNQERYSNNRTEYREVIVENKIDKRLIEQLKKENQFLEAGLCAVIRELDKRKISKEIIEEANKNGMIDLNLFWGKHSIDDEVRISNVLKNFSQHEKEIIKDLLNR